VRLIWANLGGSFVPVVVMRLAYATCSRGDGVERLGYNSCCCGQEEKSELHLGRGGRDCELSEKLCFETITKRMVREKYKMFLRTEMFILDRFSRWQAMAQSQGCGTAWRRHRGTHFAANLVLRVA
jgi:hypothetical protein